MPDPHARAPKRREPEPDFDIDSAVCIVVGAHPRAELGDRDVAYLMRDRLAAVLDALAEDFPEHPALRPVVLTDIWYLNDAALRARATISIGGPGVNALTASLIDRLPSAFVIDDVLSVQLDVDMGDLVAACWGVSHDATRGAVEAFTERYLSEFVAAAVVRSGLRSPV